MRASLRERVDPAVRVPASDGGAHGLPARGDEWDVREQGEHVLYWERDSVDTAMRK